MMAHDPVMLFQFNEAATATTVTDSAAAGGVITGTLVGDGPEPGDRATEQTPAPPAGTTSTSKATASTRASAAASS